MKMNQPQPRVPRPGVLSSLVSFIDINVVERLFNTPTVVHILNPRHPVSTVLIREGTFRQRPDGRCQVWTRHLMLLTLARAARKVVHEAGRKPIEVLEDILLDKFHNKLFDGKQGSVP